MRNSSQSDFDRLANHIKAEILIIFKMDFNFFQASD